ncbi:MAG TPA: T9SS type A sorting domain-containing protein [Taishania sp.]|nr:T9SS type A sorting domain-containing protein [Taishania sp.]
MKALIILFFLVVAFSINAQTPFYKQFSGSGYDYGQGIDELPDSSYIITGSSSSFTDGPSQMFLLKIDSLGNYLWSSSYGGTETDWGRRVKHVANEGYFVGGFTNSSGNGAYDFALWKIDETGNELWFKTFGTDGRERMHDMAITSDSGFVLVGETNKTTDGLTDVYVVRTDASGNELWTKQFANDGEDNAFSIKMLDDSTFIVAGTRFIGTKNEAWFMRLQDNGDTLWTNHHSINSFDFKVNDIEIVSGVIYGIGAIKDNVNNTYNHHIILKVNATNGSLIGSDISGSNYMQGQAITTFAQNGLFCVATSMFEEGVSFGQDDVIFYGYNNIPVYYGNIGAVEYATQQVLGDMVTTYSFGAIAVGYNEEIGPGGSSVYVIRLKPWSSFYTSNDDFTTNPLVNIQSINTDNSAVVVYPNPASSVINVQTKKSNDYQIQLIDVLGNLVFNQTYMSTKQLSIDATHLENGIYLLQLISNEGKSTLKIEIAK